MSKDKELQCNLLEWFLCNSDAECGLKSSTASIISHIEAGAHIDDGARRVRSAPREEYEDVRTRRLASSWQSQEDDLREYYKSFGIGVTMPNDLGRSCSAPADPYDSSQCDFSDKTKFAKARRLWKQWRELSRSTQRLLAAWYMGMNPEEALEVRVAYQDTFGDFAAVAYWQNITIPLGDEFSAGDRVQLKIDVENSVRAAHREWYNVGQRLFGDA